AALRFSRRRPCAPAPGRPSAGGAARRTGHARRTDVRDAEETGRPDRTRGQRVGTAPPRTRGGTMTDPMMQLRSADPARRAGLGAVDEAAFAALREEILMTTTLDPTNAASAAPAAPP